MLPIKGEELNFQLGKFDEWKSLPEESDSSELITSE